MWFNSERRLTTSNESWRTFNIAFMPALNLWRISGKLENDPNSDDASSIFFGLIGAGIHCVGQGPSLRFVALGNPATTLSDVATK
jgi:hypothetical protein